MKNREESQGCFGFTLKMEAVYFPETSLTTRHITKGLVASIARVAE
jgi:hypothetical protein